jgi:uncharacterized protein (DUF2236 family)
MATRDEFDRRLERLNATLTAMRRLIGRIQDDEETTAYEDEGLNAEAVQVMREMAAASRDVRAVLDTMSDEERDRLVDESSDPELLKAFFRVF